MYRFFFTLIFLTVFASTSHAVFERAEEINDRYLFISADKVDRYGNPIKIEITEDDSDIFLYNETPLSINIPSSIFYRARAIHNNPEITDYEKREQFYYLTIEAVEKFYSYAIELQEGARDIVNCEDEVEAILSYLQIIFNNDHNYKDHVSTQTLEKIEDIFMIIDAVVKHQIIAEMDGKSVYYSILDTPQLAYPIGEDDEYLPTVILNAAKEIHQSELSIYQKKRDIVFLIYNSIDLLSEYLKKFNDGKKDPELMRGELTNAYNFLTVIKNSFDYRELMQEPELIKIDDAMFILEILLGLKESVNVYLQ